MEKYGASQTGTKSMFTTLANSEHRVTTAYGVSTTSYGGKKRSKRRLFLLQGIGQGNGAGPAAFIFLSSVCIEVIRRKGHCSVMTAAISLVQLAMVCFSFVDDSDLQHVAHSTEVSGEALVPAGQAALDCWVGTLGVTGAALNVEKSYWYLLDFEWKNSGWHYRPTGSMPVCLLLINCQLLCS